jgi:hypothetical protein
LESIKVLKIPTQFLEAAGLPFPASWNRFRQKHQKVSQSIILTPESEFENKVEAIISKCFQLKCETSSINFKPLLSAGIKEVPAAFIWFRLLF